MVEINDRYHIVHLFFPFFIRFFIPNFWRCFLFIYLWETFEQVLFEFTNSYVFFYFARPGSETMTNALIWDPLQGLLGLLWAHYLVSYQYIPQQYESWKRYLLFFIFFLPSCIWCGWIVNDIHVGIFIILLGCYSFLYFTIGLKQPLLWWNCSCLLLISMIPFPVDEIFRTWIGLGSCIFTHICFQL